MITQKQGDANAHVYYCPCNEYQAAFSPPPPPCRKSSLGTRLVSADLACMALLHITQLCAMWYTAFLWLLQFIEVILPPAPISEIFILQIFVLC